MNFSLELNDDSLLLDFLNSSNAIDSRKNYHKLDSKYAYDYTFRSDILPVISYLQINLNDCSNIVKEDILDLLHMFSCLDIDLNIDGEELIEKKFIVFHEATAIYFGIFKNGEFMQRMFALDILLNCVNYYPYLKPKLEECIYNAINTSDDIYFREGLQCRLDALKSQ